MAVHDHRRYPPSSLGFSVSAVLQDGALRVPLTYFVAAQLLDILTTVVGLFRGLAEYNPVTADVLHRFGTFGLLLQKVPVVIALVLGVALLPRRVAVGACWAFSLVMAAVVASNITLVAATRT